VQKNHPFSGLGHLTIFAEDGHLQCHGSDPSNCYVTWNRDTVTLRGRTLHEAALALLPGRPVTDLIEHHILSRNMIVTEAVNNFQYGGGSIYVTIEQPRRLFCGRSGRVWSWSGNQA